MGNHCVELVCHECGYYKCARCSDSGVGPVPSGGMLARYQEDKAAGKLGWYKVCPNCGAQALR